MWQAKKLFAQFALGMSGIESVGDLDGEGQGFVKGKRAAGDGVLEGAAVRKLHDDERMRIGFANFVDGGICWGD
jgi:hypothetical protein